MKISCLQVGPIAVNCYLVCDEAARLCAIVDPGGDADRVAAAGEQTGCRPDCILLTHGHYDHTGGVAGLRQRWQDIPVYINRRDVHPAGESRLFLPLPEDVRNYDEGDEVRMGGLTFHVLATPGHSAGSVTLQVENVLLCGDTLFAGSCGRTDFPDGSMEQMMASLRRLDALVGDYAVLPGHMKTSTLSRERAGNPYLLHARKG